jgi:hypothetical protein
VSQPKRHHYVPRFYLERFTSLSENGNPILWVYDKNTIEPRAQTPLNTCVESGFYSFETSTGTDVEIEKALALVESDAKEVLDQLRQQGADLRSYHIPMLSNFLALTHVRVPRTLSSATELMNAATLQYIKGQAQNRERIDRYFQEAGDRYTKRSDKEEFRRLLSDFDKHFTIEVNPKSALLESLSLFPSVAELFRQMNWHLFRAPQGTYFITSDTPLCVFVPMGHGAEGFGAGIGRESAQVTFPISPSILLLLDWRRNQRRAAIGKNFVREANRRMAWSAERYVISNIRSRTTAELVRKAAATRNHPKMDPDRLKKYVERQWQQHFRGRTR